MFAKVNMNLTRHCLDTSQEIWEPFTMFRLVSANNHPKIYTKNKKKTWKLSTKSTEFYKIFISRTTTQNQGLFPKVLTRSNLNNNSKRSNKMNSKKSFIY